MKFAIGDEVWHAQWTPVSDFITCPDCGGDGRIRCLLHDDTMVSVECSGCRSGYHAPSGRIQVYNRTPVVKISVITGIEINGDQDVEYTGTGFYHVKESELFLERDAAMARATEMAVRADADERDKINRKEKDSRSWSWHVHYYRKEIRECQKRIEYAQSKLNVARLKARVAAAETAS